MGEDAGGAAHARRLSIVELRDLNAGLFGVQVVWGLQNVNTSRVFQTLGADIAQLPLLWIAAPITGLLIQPLIGRWSDRHRGRWGRRKPFIAVGTVLTALAMLVMARAATLGAAVLALWLLTAAVNVAMQPFRALAADRIPPSQRATGFALQVCFIGAGAVFASVLPWMLVNTVGVAGTAPPGMLPASLRLAFEIGAAVLALTVGWTLLRAREAPGAVALVAEPAAGAGRSGHAAGGLAWLGGGVLIAAIAGLFALRHETYLLAAVTIGYGALRLRLDLKGGAPGGVLAIVADIAAMPRAMRRLALTQFLSWFALFTMWVYAVPAVAARQFHASGIGDPAYAAAGNWVGILFAAHDAVAVGAALALPWVVARLGLRGSHAACLAITALGLGGLLLIDDPAWLLVPALGVGIGWASILSAPYVIVANAVPPDKVGVYMGIHNMFLVMPQLVAAGTLGALLDHVLKGDPTSVLLIAAAAMALAAGSAFWLPAD